jgi:rare lipoprotein A
MRRGLIALLAVLVWLCSPPLAAQARAGRHHARLTHIDMSGRAQSGRASYYASHAVGRKTASGERYVPGRMTAASRTLPLGSRARVTNLRNGRSVEVTVTDRGPFVKSRIMDVSSGAADHLGMKGSGVAPVKVQPLATPRTAGR